MTKAHQDGKPFFVWWNSRACTSGRTSSRKALARPALGVYPDGMVEHDAMVGQLLDKLKELGVNDNTIVMYSSNNGAETMRLARRWYRSIRGERTPTGKAVPAFHARFAGLGVIEPSTWLDIGSHEDMVPR